MNLLGINIDVPDTPTVVEIIVNSQRHIKLDRLACSRQSTIRTQQGQNNLKCAHGLSFEVI
jgi:hypothetical protein